MRTYTWLEYGCVQLAFGFSFLSTCVYFLDMNTAHGRVSDEIIVCLISIRVCLLNEPRSFQVSSSMLKELVKSSSLLGFKAFEMKKKKKNDFQQKNTVSKSSHPFSRRRLTSCANEPQIAVYLK